MSFELLLENIFQRILNRIDVYNNANNSILLFVDFEKAFDLVEWISKIPQKLNFLDNSITWIQIQ